jgi:hypothetical protein
MRNRLQTASLSLLVSISLATSVAGCVSDAASSRAPSPTFAAHVFVPPLPECPIVGQDGIPVRDAGKALLGKKVAFRGFLTLSAGRSCRCGYCPADEWRVVGAEARVHDPYRGRPATALLVWLPILLPRDDLDSPDLDVIATGVLREAELTYVTYFFHGYYKEFLLEDAEICKVKASSPRHAPPFQLPPSGADNCVDLHG